MTAFFFSTLSDFEDSSDDEKASARQSKTKSVAKVDDSEDGEYVEVDTCLAKRSGRAVTPDSPCARYAVYLSFLNFLGS